MHASAVRFECAALVTDSSIMNAEIKLPLFFLWFVVGCDSSLLIIISQRRWQGAYGAGLRGTAELTAGHMREPAVAGSV